jgi:hypothetical protein
VQIEAAPEAQRVREDHTVPLGLTERERGG